MKTLHSLLPIWIPDAATTQQESPNFRYPDPVTGSEIHAESAACFISLPLYKEVCSNTRVVLRFELKESGGSGVQLLCYFRYCSQSKCAPFIWTLLKDPAGLVKSIFDTT